jgi:hypothetical protein
MVENGISLLRFINQDRVIAVEQVDPILCPPVTGLQVEKCVFAPPSLKKVSPGR